MSQNSALSSPQYTSLRSLGTATASAYSGVQNVSLCDNVVALAGQVNSDLTTPQTWASFNYNNVSAGTYTNVRANMVLLIGTVNDIAKATFRGRIRGSVTSSVINCNESSQDFTVGAYFWVIYSWEPDYVQSHPSTNDPATVVELVDYNQTYQGLLPVVTGLQTAYAQYVNTGTGKYRIAFSLSAYAAESGASISSYSTEIIATGSGTYSVVSGALNTASFTVDFSYGEFFVLSTVTDSGGRSLTRVAMVKAHDATNYPVNAYFDKIPISRQLLRGDTAKLPAFAGVDNTLNRTMTVIWRSDEQYSGTTGAIGSVTLDFIGWLDKETGSAGQDYPNYSQTATFDVLGVGPMAAKLWAESLGLTMNASPSLWGQIVNLTPWRALWHFFTRYTTIAVQSDVVFDDHSDTFLFSAIPVQGSSVLDAYQKIGDQYNAIVEYTPWGALYVNRDVTYTHTALVNVADWTSADSLIPIEREIDPNPNVGKVDADGAFYNTSTGVTTAFAARAPGHAQGEAQGATTLTAQILAATTNGTAALNELRQRSGDKLSYDNTNEFLTVIHPDGYVGIPLLPSRAQTFTWTLNQLAANGVNRIVYDASVKWTIDTVDQEYSPDGTWQVKVRYRRVCNVGDLGDDTTPVAPNQTDLTVPDLGLPAFNFEDLPFPEVGLLDSQINPAQLLPPTGKIAGFKGDELITWSTTNAYYCTNVAALKTPKYRDVTPSDLGSFQIKQIVVDPFFTNTAIGAYLLGSDGTNSAVWYTSNIAAGSVVWTKGATVSGAYKVIRATNIQGSVLIYGSDSTASVDYDFTSSSQGFSPITNGTPPGNRAVYTPSVGWTRVYNFAGAGDSETRIYKAVTGTFNIIQITVNTSVSASLSLIDNADGVPSSLIHSWTTGTGVQTLTYSTPFTLSNGLRLDLSANSGNYTLTITDVQLTLPSTNSGVRYSSNYAGLFGAGIPTGGALPAAGGFDVQRSGANSFAAAAGAVYRATTLGGSYSSYYSVTGGANPVCIIVPYITWGGSSNTTATNPDIIVGLDAPDGSSRTLLWIEGGATPGTVHDLTPVASYVFDNANAITTSYNHHIATMGKVSGTYSLRRTTNKGGAWSNVGTITSPTFIRDRRNDTSTATSGTNKGQCYLINNGVLDYTNTWFNTGFWPRTLPTLVGLETIW